MHLRLHVICEDRLPCLDRSLTRTDTPCAGLIATDALRNIGRCLRESAGLPFRSVLAEGMESRAQVHLGLHGQNIKVPVLETATNFHGVIVTRRPRYRASRLRTAASELGRKAA